MLLPSTLEEETGETEIVKSLCGGGAGGDELPPQASRVVKKPTETK